MYLLVFALAFAKIDATIVRSELPHTRPAMRIAGRRLGIWWQTNA